MKAKLISVLAALLLLLAGCGYASPAAGLYTCTGMEAAGHTWPASVPAPEGLSLELYADGKGLVNEGEESAPMSWLLSGDALRIEIGGTVWDGTLRGGEIRLGLPGESGGVLCFSSEAAAPAPAEEVLSVGYYGRWAISGSEGKLPNTWYDCCAVLEPGEDGGLVLTLWDEDSSRLEPIGRVLFRRADGLFSSERGYFWLMEIPEGLWSLDPAAPALVLSGEHDAGGERFHYEITLRPFGARWDDAEAKPYHYDDWYLPLIEAGETLPDSMD